jgi:hypothetical protein
MNNDEQTSLAVGFRDYWVYAWSGTFLLGGTVGFLLVVYMRGWHVIVQAFVEQARWVPLALAIGFVLSFLDWQRTHTHLPQYADLESARRQARGWALVRQQVFRKAKARHKWLLAADTIVPAVAGFLFLLAVRGGLLRATWPWLLMYGTELFWWRLIWRRRLLTHEQGPGHS